MATSPHVASLTDAKPIIEKGGSSITGVGVTELPLLERLSIRRLVLAPGAVREPHWHTNAHELTYCLAGEALVTVFGNESEHHRFTIRAGQMFFAPSGSLHVIENIGGGTCELIAAFTHEDPQEFGLSGSLGVFTDAVLGNTVDQPASAFAARRHGTGMDLIQYPEQVATPTEDDERTDPLKFDIEAQAAPIAGPPGSAKLARDQFWPVLANISMYSLRVNDEGMREPHWHPVTAEMGYIAKGHARMTILNPDGSWDTYLLSPGDVYFVPRAYPHQIEVIGEEEIHFLIFFDQPTPGDIGYRATFSALRRGLLAASLGLPVRELPPLPFTAVDPLLVSKANPTDPVTTS